MSVNNMTITFHPYASFEKSAKVLDYKRLGKQRQEALHVLKCLLGMAKPYKSHGAMNAWRGYEPALCEYGIVICSEWISRNYEDNTKHIFQEIRYDRLRFHDIVLPKWIGYEPYHSNQRARLLYKDPIWYDQFGWTEKPTKLYEFPEHLYRKI
jgi:hypothetical protein